MPGLSGSSGAVRLRLNLGLFVYAQDQRAFGRVEVKSHDVGQLAVELGVGAELEVFWSYPVSVDSVGLGFNVFSCLRLFALVLV